MATKKEKALTRQGSVSENFFAVNHASLILPKRGSTSEPVKNMKSLHFGGDLKTHLYAIIHVVRPQDQIKLVARLESWMKDHIRYLVIVSTIGRQDTEESLILGIDFAEGKKDECTIGFAVPIYNDVTADLDGDGGFDLKVPARNRSFSFKPVSVQAMWSALHTLHHCISIAQYNNYFNGSLFLTWTCYYESRIQSSRIFINEWEHEEQLFERRRNYYFIKDKEQEATELKIRGALKEVLMRMDLDNCKSRDVRIELEKTIDLDLTRYKSFIDQEMVTLLFQMDTASKIFDFLYLGSAWNAADQEELKRNGITHILNISMIVDNYFPDDIVYKNIRLYDEEEAELLPLWNDTYKFLKRAIKRGGKCLVHCRMGISRSSSTVIAFVMKEMQWSMEKALNYVREKRPIASPNPGFMKQLQEYEGILKASSQRHNVLFRSLSENNLATEQNSPKKEDGKAAASSAFLQGNFDYHRHLLDITTGSRRHRLKRSKSWTAGDSKFEDDDIMRAELYGDESTEPFSEPQNPSSKSAGNDKETELTTINKYGSKRKKKFKRRHTEMGFAWQSSDTDIPPRSDESMVANSDCGIPTHRFSWDKSSVTSSEESQSIVTRPFSTKGRHSSCDEYDASGDKNDRSSSCKGSRTSGPRADVIDEVFEEGDDDTDHAIPRQPSVKNLVNNIETKCFVKTHSRQSSNEKEFVKTGKSPPQHTIESQIPIVPEVSIVENQNSNNNSLPNTISTDTDAKVAVDPMVLSQENDINSKEKGYQTLSEDQLRIIREVGKTFTGEIPPRNDNLINRDSETCQSQGGEGIVRKGLVRRMARAIENHNKLLTHDENLHSVKTISTSVAKEDTSDTTQSDCMEFEASPCAIASTAPSITSEGQKSVTLHGHLPHIFSVVAPTPYHQFQKSIKTGRSIKKRISYEVQRYRRGVTRSQSERGYTMRMQSVTKDAANVTQADLSEDTLEHSTDCAPVVGDHRNTTEADLGSWNRRAGICVRDEDEGSENNLNRIDRQNSLYKSI